MLLKINPPQQGNYHIHSVIDSNIIKFDNFMYAKHEVGKSLDMLRQYRYSVPNRKEPFVALFYTSERGRTNLKCVA